MASPVRNARWATRWAPARATSPSAAPTCHESKKSWKNSTSSPSNCSRGSSKLTGPERDVREHHDCRIEESTIKWGGIQNKHLAVIRLEWTPTLCQILPDSLWNLAMKDWNVVLFKVDTLFGFEFIRFCFIFTHKLSLHVHCCHFSASWIHTCRTQLHKDLFLHSS